MHRHAASGRRTLFVTGPGELRLQTRPDPVPGEGDVVVRVQACGVCGSDVGYLAAGGLPGPRKGPLALGHEFVGIVEAVGPGVREIEEGLRVVVNPDDNMIGSGATEGGFSDRVVVHGARRGVNLLPVPAHLPSELAAMVEPLSVGLHGVNRARVGPGSKVVVYGAGMIGLAVVMALRHRGVDDIAVVDLNDERLSLARRFGARTTVNPGRDDLATALAEAHGTSLRYGWTLVGTDAYIDTAGAAALLDRTVSICKAGARLVVVALHKKPYMLDLLGLMAREIELMGSCAYSPDEFAEVLEMLARGAVDPSPLITHRFDFEQVLEAFAQAKAGTGAVKVMVGFSPTP